MNFAGVAKSMAQDALKSGKLPGLIDQGARAGLINPLDAFAMKQASKFAAGPQGQKYLEMLTKPAVPAATPAAAPAATPAPAAQAAAQAVQAAQVVQAAQAAGQGRAMTVAESEVVANLVKAGTALPTAVEMATAGALRLPEPPSALSTIGAALTGAGRRTYRKRKDGKKSRKGRKVRKTPRKTA